MVVSINLALTEGGGESSRGVTEHEIADLVDRFYARVREDGLIGPIFEAHVADWGRHQEKMVRFWSSAVLRTGTYSGRPYEAHRKIEGLEQVHFDRWHSIFAEVTEAVMPGSAAIFQDLGRRMGVSMLSRLLAERD